MRRANLLENGGFDGNLDAEEWTGTGVIARSLGYPRLGCCELSAGAFIRQDRNISEDQLHSLHFFYRPAAGATLTVSYAGVEQVFVSVLADAWHEGILAFALDQSANDYVTFTAAGATVYVDSVTLIGGGLPVSRADIAQAVAARIADLASDAGLVYTPNADGPDGDYSRAIDEALRAVGAVTRYGDPDVTQLLSNQINDVIESTQTAVLQRLRSRYALVTDVSLGPRRESRSQIAGSIDAMLSGAGADRRIKTARLHHGDWRR